MRRQRRVIGGSKALGQASFSLSKVNPAQWAAVCISQSPGTSSIQSDIRDGSHSANRRPRRSREREGAVLLL